jgi:nitrile hydratase accessory protein
MSAIPCASKSGPEYSRRRRNLVRRTSDGRPVNVARFRGQLFVCFDNCCCGRTEDGFRPVPVEVYHSEWERRRLRNFVHLTIGGCLGPCALANVAMLLFDGRVAWFQSVDSPALVYELYDYIEGMLEADAFLNPPPRLRALQFTASEWEARPDGAPVDDARPWRPRAQAPALRRRVPGSICAIPSEAAPDRLVADMRDAAAPRRNGELVFEAPWEGRAFGMAIAMHEGKAFEWEDFRQRLIATIAAADARGETSGYYERWAAALEDLLASRAVVSREELDERTYEFEFGERDEVF